MPNNVKVTVEWCAEDRARLDRIIELLSGLSITQTVETVTTVEAEVPAAPDGLVGVTGDTGVAGPAGVATRDDVKALVQKLLAPTTNEAKRKAARALVKRYANKVSEIPDDKLTEVYTHLSELDKGA